MLERVTKKIIIDPYRGGEDIGNNVNGIIEKEFNLNLSKYIYDRLRSFGIPVALTRENDETLDITNRVNRIQSIYGTGNDVIVLSNALTTGDEGASIVYALRNSNTLSQKIANNLQMAGLDVSKYYQRRLPSDTSKDYNQLIRDTINNETVIIYYGNIDNSEEANFLKNNLEEVGEAIVIALADYLNIDYIPISGSNNYIVKKGDSLYYIANKYNTTVDELKTLNNLSTNNLTIGQVLKLPVLKKEEDLGGKVLYTVKKGDTLYQIAANYKTTVDKLKQYNQLTSNNLNVGKVLKIPSANENNENYVTYQVVSGDSLYSIAKRYNTTVDKIKNYNQLTSNLLSIGDILKIPSPNDASSDISYLNYQVKGGDSLYGIAKRYNTTVDEIKGLNNLSTNMLSIGQMLKIPTVSKGYIIYKVQSGDNLYSIAKRYNTSVDDIKNINNLTSNLLTIGQNLKILSM